MNHYPRLAERLFNVPLLLSPTKADEIAAVFNAHLAGTVAELPKYEAPTRVDLAAAMSMRRADGGYYVTNDGVAVVEAHGSFVQRSGGLIDSLSGLTGYNAIGARLTAAERDHGVRGIVIEFDSSGGEVEGVVDLATMIADLEKPVWAHGNGIALSGAYWLAASTDRIYTTPTGLLGSIGVLMMHADRSKVIERAGVVYTPIFAGARKIDGSPMMPLSEEARSWAQARVNDVYALFVDHVARHRDIDEQTVRDTEAGILSATEAAEIGLSDGVALLGETIQMMTEALYSGALERKRYRRAAASAHPPKETQTMSNTDKPAAAPAQPAAITQADIDKARADGIAQGKAQADADAAKQAATAAEASAKARIKAITTHAEAEGRKDLAEHLAYDTEQSVEAAVAILAKSPKAGAAPANALAAKMAAEAPNPKVGAGAAGDDGEEDAEAVGRRIASYARTPLKAVK